METDYVDKLKEQGVNDKHKIRQILKSISSDQLAKETRPKQLSKLYETILPMDSI